jgi:nickel transport protein
VQLGHPVLASAPIALASALLVAEYDNGYFVKTANGYRNTSKRVLPGAPDSLWSIKFAKTLLGPAAPWDRVIGQDLELVPEANPVAVTPGGRLRVRVIFHGQPLANAEIERTDGITPMPQQDIPVFQTDSNGVADIVIERPGPQLLAIDHVVQPSATPELADKDLYNATLFFIVSPSQ